MSKQSFVRVHCIGTKNQTQKKQVNINNNNNNYLLIKICKLFE